MFFFEWFEM